MDFKRISSALIGFPLVVLEAMSVGIPIITTKVGAIYDILEEEGAKYINVGNTDEIIERIKELSNPDLRRKMGEWNKSKLAKCYTSEVVIKQLNDTYYEIIKGGK